MSPMRNRRLAALMLLLVMAAPAWAHHSAALFYENAKAVSLTGKVIRFNFRNPHAIVELLVTTENGDEQRWTCETSAPSALRRRGWSQESLKAGDIITLEGMQASDGSLLMHITRAIKEDGTEIGVPRNLEE